VKVKNQVSQPSGIGLTIWLNIEVPHPSLVTNYILIAKKGS